MRLEMDADCGSCESKRTSTDTRASKPQIRVCAQHHEDSSFHSIWRQADRRKIRMDFLDRDHHRRLPPPSLMRMDGCPPPTIDRSIDRSIWLFVSSVVVDLEYHDDDELFPSSFTFNPQSTLKNSHVSDIRKFIMRRVSSFPWLVVYGCLMAGCGSWWSSSSFPVVVLAVVPQQPLLGGLVNSQDKDKSLVADWIYAKCGPTGQRLWKYHGALYDPLDGRKIALVEGLEWVSLLKGNNETMNLPIQTQLSQLAANATNVRNIASVWSKHLFCYTLAATAKSNDDIHQNKNNASSILLQSIRIRPYSPEKHIPIDQAAAAYETTSTFVETKNGKLIVHSEWPSSTTTRRPFQFPKLRKNNDDKKNSLKKISLWSETNVLDQQQEDGILRFSVYCKRRYPQSPQYLPDFQVQEEEANDEKPSDTALTVSPRRSSWISFGMSNMESKNKFGARETYTMTVPEWQRDVSTKGWWWARLLGGRRSLLKPPSPPRLSYSRYGEGPPFYAPGRMCMLELQAEPIESKDDISAILKQLLQERVEGWDAPHPFSVDDDGSRPPLRIVVPMEDPSSGWTGLAWKVWDKARSITHMVSFFRKEKGYWSR